MSNDNAWYIVQTNDTIERIAAKLNVTPGQLRALNKISSGMLFPGQKLKLPCSAVLSPSIYDDVQSSKNDEESHRKVDFTTATKPQDATEISSEKQQSNEMPKFLKIKSKYFTKEYGTTSGLLLITSNSIMFEPDLMHPLIVEHGSTNYTVSVPLHALASVGLYENLPADPMNNNFDIGKQEVDVSESRVIDICDRDHTVSNGSSDRRTTFTIEPSHDEPHVESLEVYVNEPSPPSAVVADNVGGANHNRKVQFGLDSPDTCDGSAYTTEEGSSGMYSHSSDGLSIASGCPSLTHFFPDAQLSDTKREIDSGEMFVMQSSGETLEKRTDTSNTLIHGSIQLLQPPLQTSAPVLRVPSKDGISPASSAASFTKILDAQRILKRNETVSKLIEKTKELRNQTKFQCLSDNDDQLKHLFETKLPYPEASFVGDQIASVEAPHYLCIRIDNKKLKRSSFPLDASLIDPQIQSLNDQQRYIVHWFTIPKSQVAILYACLLNWLPADEFDQSSSATSSHFSPKQAKKSRMEEHQNHCNLGFILLQKEDRLEINDEKDQAVKRLSESECDAENGTELNLNQQWEIATVEEVKRRMSFMNIIEPDTLQLPDKSDRPIGMTDAMLDQLLRVLPPRTQGYPWRKVFSTDEDGFSLNTLFRRMVGVPDWSPSILLITDSRNIIFGGFINCPLRLSDNSLYYGTGESFVFTFKPFEIQMDADKRRRRHRSQPVAGSPCSLAQRAISLPAQESGAPTLQYFPWTGKNAFIANATRSGLVLGAGEGKFALFLDNDLNRGRTDRCDTFDNSFLTLDQDFMILRVEAFAFALEAPYVY